MPDQTNGGALMPTRGSVARQEFGVGEIERRAETSSAAVAARERAKIEAAYIMAERHPRSWDLVRVRLLAHCDRPGFAECARYRKPVGKKNINGQWVQQFAEGLSTRFAEVARQEMANTITESSVVYEDHLLRIVRASVIDLERNNIEAREFTVAKAVEKRGRQSKTTGKWEPPEGRDIISERLNSEGIPVWLVSATEDEVRQRQNSEISKVTRDCSLRMVPKDIRDEAEARCVATLADPKRTDPTAARKRLIDSFAQLNVMPDDLVTYIGGALDRISPAQLDELRGLYQAIRDGEISFNAALKAKYDTAGTSEETVADHDIRLQRQMDQQLPRKTPGDVAERKITELTGGTASGLKPITQEDIDAAIAAKTKADVAALETIAAAIAEPAPLSEEEMRAATERAAVAEGQMPAKATFGRRR